MRTQAKVLANPGFYYKFSPIHGISQYHIRSVLSDSLMNQESRSAKAGNETKIKATSGLIALLSLNYSCVMLPSIPLKVVLK